MQFGANLGLERANGAGELHGIRDDVSNGAAVNGADGYDAEFSWILFAADHALHVDDEPRRNRNGIDGRVRRRTVTAAPLECYLEAVGSGRANPATIEDRAMSEWAVMQGKRDVGLGKAREQAMRKHGTGAGHNLFRRLGDEHQRAAPLVFQAEQCLRRSDPARHVDVVAAAMGDEHLPPVPVGLVAAPIVAGGLFFLWAR